jgi:hypothetical protein
MVTVIGSMSALVHFADIWQGSESASNGLMQRSEMHLLDHVVRTHKKIVPVIRVLMNLPR